MYSPSIGRFIERDSIDSDPNLYRYCGNHAVSESDPSGQAPWYFLTARNTFIDEGWWGGFTVQTAFWVEPFAGALPDKTAWVIQYVTASFDVKDADTGQRVVHPSDNGKWSFWEAGPVAQLLAPPVDEFFVLGGIANTCGTIVVTGTSQFYRDTQLPMGRPDFFPNNPDTNAGGTPSTKNPLSVRWLRPSSFPPLVHTVVATWTTANAGRTKVTDLISKPAPDPWPQGLPA
jgi:hypothetical protein